MQALLGVRRLHDLDYNSWWHLGVLAAGGVGNAVADAAAHPGVQIAVWVIDAAPAAARAGQSGRDRLG